VDLRSTLRTACAGALVGWLGLADLLLSGQSALHARLLNAEYALEADGSESWRWEAEGVVSREQYVAAQLDGLGPVFAGHRWAWVDGKGLLGFSGANFVPWWLALGERERYASLMARKTEYESLYRPDASLTSKVVAAVAEARRAGPPIPVIESLPAAKKWILYAEASGAVHPLHRDLRSDAVAGRGEEGTWFAVVAARRLERLPTELDTLGACFERVDLVVGRTSPVEVVGVLRAGFSADEMVESTHAAREWMNLITGAAPEPVVAPPGTAAVEADASSCTAPRSRLSELFGTWLRH
jgi:hypothetical protein